MARCSAGSTELRGRTCWRHSSSPLLIASLVPCPRTVGACCVLDAGDVGALVATDAAVPHVRLQVDAQARAARVSSGAHEPALPAAVASTKTPEAGRGGVGSQGACATVPVRECALVDVASRLGLTAIGAVSVPAGCEVVVAEARVVCLTSPLQVARLCSAQPPIMPAIRTASLCRMSQT